MNEDFWTETALTFKRRLDLYEKSLRPIEDFTTREARFTSLMTTYFQLYEDPTKYTQVKQDLTQLID